MLKVTLENLDQVTAILRKLADMAESPRPALKAIGENLSESTKRRFETGTGPDGRRWAPNATSTELLALKRYKTNFTKTGRISKKGMQRLTGKKPLIGLSKTLSTTINYKVSGNAVEIGSPTKYAAVQQFGEKKGSLGKGAPWGDIPARPFLGLSRDDQGDVLDVLKSHLRNVVDG